MRHIWVTALLLASCAADSVLDLDPDADPDPELGRSTAASIMSNGIKSDAVWGNAVLGNRLASEILVTRSLPAALADWYVKQQLSDAASWDVLPYLISCALGPNDQITVTSQTQQMTYWGGLGLARSWLTQPLDVAGQERVSGCFLSRVNAYGHPVALSGRFEPASICINLPTVRPSSFRQHTNTQVASLTPSTTAVEYQDAGWNVDRVGTCGRGTSVTVSTYNFGGSANGPAVLRVCPGIHACDDADSIRPVTNTRWNDRDQLAFTCPSAGTFSVMTAPRKRSQPPTTVKPAGTVTGGKFPAPEGWQSADQAVFTWREGVFYGNILGASSFNKYFLDNSCDKYGHCTHPTQPYGLVVWNAYAAYSDVWSNGAAYMHERLCAGIQANCVAAPQGPAKTVCALSDGTQRPGDGDYQQCKGANGVIYTTGMTTYLENACEVNITNCATL